ncbi:MAG: potassium transporter [Gammaproteobacteria bacterium]|nr:potassium transporter [Gammaproteobacteria bacterium]
MHWRAILRLMGILLFLYSFSFIPSFFVSLYYDDAQSQSFLASTAMTALLGVLFWFFNRRHPHELSVRDGFLFVALFWIILGAVGAFPFLVGLHLNFTDAMFESFSGFTTTGATVIIGLDALPRSILYHRQQSQWIGGMGIIVWAVAILPLLGMGGMQLYRAEMSGVTKDEKLTPRIAETARAFWLIYLSLTLACMVAYYLAGMPLFDAIGHAYATVATAGFSTHDASLAYFDSPLIESIAMFFMIAGSVNFAVHFFAWRHRQLSPYGKDFELRAFLWILLACILLVALTLWQTNTYATPLQALRHSAFQSVSIMTTCGFSTATFGEWPLHIPLVLIIVGFIGGCAGSTTGGIKVLRIILMAKMGLRQLYVLSHPQAYSVVKLGQRTVDDNVLFSVWGFYVLFILTALALTVLMMAAGLNLETAFGATFATLTLVGPGIGAVSSNFAGVSDNIKWLGIIGMLVGRLEVFTLLILFMPSYWRR